MEMAYLYGFLVPSISETLSVENFRFCPGFNGEKLENYQMVHVPSVMFHLFFSMMTKLVVKNNPTENSMDMANSCINSPD